MCTLRNPTRLPPQKFMLTLIRNKVQLIDLICEGMAFHKDDISHHKFVLTGSDPVPVEINKGVIIKRQDVKTKQEEADTMVVQQVEEVKAKKVLVVAEDTDIIVYLFFGLDHDMPMCSVSRHLSRHLVSGHIVFHQVSPSQLWSASISLFIYGHL